MMKPGKNGYRIDFNNNVVVMNYKFAAAASTFGSVEYEIVKGIRSDFPQMKEVVVSGREQTTPRHNHRLTYKNMEQYIGACNDSKALLLEFETVKAQSKTATSPYKYVCDWFVNQFPNYKTALKADQALKRVA